jgi:spore maturation protein A
MNVIFSLIFILATGILLVIAPEQFLQTMLDGASKSAATCVALIATYAVWLGLMQVWQDSGVARGVSRLIKPLTKRLLKTDNEEALDAAAMNLSVNLLGISGAATPYGIQTAKLLDKTENAEFSSAMFFVLNATSLQIFPASMIAVRVSMHSAAPYDILLPTLFATTLSTILGVWLVRVCFREKKATKSRGIFGGLSRKFMKTKGAGME